MQEIQELLHGQRWGALATLDKEAEPSASAVAYALDFERRQTLFLLSGLAGHSTNLQRHPRGSLLVTAPDLGEADPQTLPRVTLSIQVDVMDREDEDFERTAQIYRDQLPDSEMLFSLGDFQIFRGTPLAGHYVGGFGRAMRLDKQAAIELFEPIAST